MLKSYPHFNIASVLIAVVLAVASLGCTDRSVIEAASSLNGPPRNGDSPDGPLAPVIQQVYYMHHGVVVPLTAVNTPSVIPVRTSASELGEIYVTFDRCPRGTLRFYAEDTTNTLVLPVDVSCFEGQAVFTPPLRFLANGHFFRLRLPDFSEPVATLQYNLEVETLNLQTSINFNIHSLYDSVNDVHTITDMGYLTVSFQNSEFWRRYKDQIRVGAESARCSGNGSPGSMQPVLNSAIVIPETSSGSLEITGHLGYYGGVQECVTLTLFEGTELEIHEFYTDEIPMAYEASLWNGPSQWIEFGPNPLITMTSGTPSVPGTQPLMHGAGGYYQGVSTTQKGFSNSLAFWYNVMVTTN